MGFFKISAKIFDIQLYCKKRKFFPIYFRYRLLERFQNYHIANFRF